MPTPTPTPKVATLVYTDPTTGDYRLVRNAVLSAANHLVLDLVGPVGVKGRGVMFELQLSGSGATVASWASLTAADKNLVGSEAFLGSGCFVHGSTTGAGSLVLRGLAGQKGTQLPTVNLGAGTALARVAIGIPTTAGESALALAVVPARTQVVPEAAGVDLMPLLVNVGNLSIQLK